MTYCPQCGLANADGTRFCTSCGAALSGTVAVRQQAESEAADPLLGRTIEGKYRFDEKLGAGGMGAVYKATRLLIGDTVAIKVLHPSQAVTAQAGERFRREAQAAARFKHPNSVAIYDFGVTGDGLLYLIMELAEGQSLRRMIQDKGALPLPLAAEIMKQTCAALDEAHRHSIVHRDIKPDNIMVKMTGTGAQVKVLDFGIARIRDLAGADTLTQHGSVIGTPHYMSPEQCLGEELDGRSDIYSLGVVLYEMLSGTAPFNGNTSREIISKHISQRPPQIRSIKAELSDEIEALLQQVLEKDREARPQTAAVLAKALDNAINLPATETTRKAVPPTRAAGPAVPPASPGIPTPPQPQPIGYSPSGPHTQTANRSRGWFTPFAIGCGLASIVGIGVLAFLIILGSMQDEQKNTNTEQASPTPVEQPTAAASVPSFIPPAKVTVSARASSSRADYRGISYLPTQTLDGSMLTAWIEGVPGPGQGEWIQFDFNREVNLKLIHIAPGYFKSAEVWAKNNRLAEATLEFSDGTTRQVTFSDEMSEQVIDLGGIRTTSVRIIIGDVHLGSTDSEDTAISQIAFEYEPDSKR